MSDVSELYRLFGRLEQRISNLIRPGLVSEVQMDPPRVKVEYDKDADGNAVTTAWLRYFEERQGYAQTWNPPKVGEQCLILSPCGDLRLGKVLLGLNTTDNAPISTDKNIHLIKFADGSSFEFDRSSSTWNISLGTGEATFTGSTFTFNANMVINGDVTHTGSYSQTGDYTQVGNITQTGSYGQTGSFTSTGTVTGKVVSDSMGTMVGIRATYNAHNHATTNLLPSALME